MAVVFYNVTIRATLPLAVNSPCLIMVSRTVLIISGAFTVDGDVLVL